MKKGSKALDGMLPEYDFSGGVRGKYAKLFSKDAVMVVLDPDVAEVFPTSKSVNRALRALKPLIRERAGQGAGGSGRKAS